MQHGAASPDATQRAGAQIYGMAQTQARLLSYVDVTWVMVAATAILIPLPFLMKRPEKVRPRPHQFGGSHGGMHSLGDDGTQQTRSPHRRRY